MPAKGRREYVLKSVALLNKNVKHDLYYSDTVTAFT